MNTLNHVAISNGFSVPMDGSYFIASGNATRLMFQADGNLVIYDQSGVARWQSKTASTQVPSPGATCAFANGNLSVSDARGDVLWQSGTSGENAVLLVQADGNVVIYSPWPHAAWASNTEA